MGKIRYLEHTADAAVEITAASREELFLLGARALYKLILDYDAVQARSARSWELGAPAFPDLFHEWLAELLYVFDTEGWVGRKFAFVFDDGGTAVKVRGEGEELDGERHRPHGEVKNVTYCDFVVEPRGEGWFARVIFDL